MKSVTKKQIAVLAGSLVLVVLLLLANTKLPQSGDKVETTEHSGEHNHNGNLTGLIDKLKTALPAKQKQELELLAEALKYAADKKTAYQNIINRLDSLRQPILAAYYMEQASLASPVELNWMEAGNRYYAATRFVQDAEQTGILYNKAIECYSKTVELNPNNTDAKINLASCYVEGSTDPMKGIGMLKEIEKTDSNNVNLQLNFAFFSEKSGQWDKAIVRFEKILQIKPDFIEAYLHLADAYTQMGNTEKAIENLEKYKNLVDDVTIKTEIQDYINKLKNT